MVKIFYILILGFILLGFCKCSNTDKKTTVSYQKQDSLLIEDLLNRADTCFDLGQANHYNLKAKAHIDRQLKKNVRTKGLLLHLARNLNNRGVFSSHFETTDNELNHYYKALGIAEFITDDNITASIHNNIGFYFSNNSEFELAIHHYDLAIAYYTKAKNMHDIAYIYSNIAGLYANLKDTVFALNYYQNSIKTATLNTTGDKQIIGVALNNIGNIYNAKKEYKLAMDYFNKAEALETELGDMYGFITTLQNKSEIYIVNNKKDTAEIYLKKAYNLSDSLSLIEQKQQVARALIRFYKYTHNTKQALFYTSQLDSNYSRERDHFTKYPLKTDTVKYQKMKKDYKDSVGKNQNLF
jgi:tetratricopeptide (TPR) repeat protein